MTAIKEEINLGRPITFITTDGKVYKSRYWAKRHQAKLDKEEATVSSMAKAAEAAEIKKAEKASDVIKKVVTERKAIAAKSSKAVKKVVAERKTSNTKSSEAVKKVVVERAPAPARPTVVPVPKHSGYHAISGTKYLDRAVQKKHPLDSKEVKIAGVFAAAGLIGLLVYVTKLMFN